MIVEELKKLKKNNYSVVVEGKSYIFDEDVVLEYKLFKGHEIDSEVLNEAIKKNDIMEYYHKASAYSIKYAKGEGATIDYLVNKGLSLPESKRIVNKLVENKIINDKMLIETQMEGLVRKKYGRLYIREKLRERKFDYSLIDEELSSIDYSLYYENMNSLYKEALKKYKGDKFIVNAKAKKYLLSRGFTFDDLNKIDFL